MNDVWSFEPDVWFGIVIVLKLFNWTCQKAINFLNGGE